MKIQIQRQASEGGLEGNIGGGGGDSGSLRLSIPVLSFPRRRTSYFNTGISQDMPPSYEEIYI